MLNKFSPRTKRRAVIVLLCVVPLLLFAVIREKHSWQPRTLLLPPTSKAMDVKWLADNRTLAVNVSDKVASQSTLQFWDAKTSSLVGSPDFKGREFGRYFPHSGAVALYKTLKSDQTQLIMEDLKSRKQLCSFDFGIQETLLHTDDGRAFCVIKKNTNGTWLSRVYQVAPRRLLREAKIQPPQQMRIFSFQAISPNLKIVALNCISAFSNQKDGLLLFDTQTGKHLTFLSSPHIPSPMVTSFSDDSQDVMIAGYGMAQLRNAHTGQLKHSFRSPPMTIIRQLQLPTGDRHWLLGVEERSVFVWDARSGKLLREIKLRNWAMTFSLSPDQSTLAIVTDKNEVLLCRMH